MQDLLQQELEELMLLEAMHLAPQPQESLQVEVHLKLDILLMPQARLEAHLELALVGRVRPELVLVAQTSLPLVGQLEVLAVALVHPGLVIHLELVRVDPAHLALAEVNLTGP